MAAHPAVTGTTVTGAIAASTRREREPEEGELCQSRTSLSRHPPRSQGKAHLGGRRSRRHANEPHAASVPSSLRMTPYSSNGIRAMVAARVR
jgi:hypothetical protein